MFEVFLVMLNGVASDIIEDEECRTHIVFTKAATLTSFQLQDMMTASRLAYPAPIELNQVW